MKIKNCYVICIIQKIYRKYLPINTPIYTTTTATTTIKMHFK